MKYALLIYSKPGSHEELSPEDYEQALGEYRELVSDPRCLASGQLQPVETATTVRIDNGSALTNLAGYYVYYGTSPGSLSNVVNISNPSTLSYVVSSLSAGTWYFAVAAYTNTGLASPMSNVGSKTIT